MSVSHDGFATANRFIALFPEPLGIGTNNGRVLPSVSAVLLGAWRPSARGASPEDDSADDGRARTLSSKR